jgi:hypothetical protein
MDEKTLEDFWNEDSLEELKFEFHYRYNNFKAAVASGDEEDVQTQANMMLHLQSYMTKRNPQFAAEMLFKMRILRIGKKFFKL